MADRVKAAILGSGNIGTDLMVKLLRSRTIELTMVAGIDPQSEGLRKAREAGLKTTVHGIDGLLAEPDVGEIVFEDMIIDIAWELNQRKLTGKASS